MVSIKNLLLDSLRFLPFVFLLFFLIYLLIINTIMSKTKTPKKKYYFYLVVTLLSLLTSIWISYTIFSIVGASGI